jgi:type I restriction enzyme S subunit
MLLSNLDLLATAPGGVARLRELILTLAVQGKLVPQDPADEPASVLLQKTRAEKDRLIAEGKIRRDKPLAEIAEGEKPFEVPEGWEWTSLATIGVINPRNDAPDETLASFVQMSSIPVEFSAAHVSEPRPWKDIKSGFTQFAEGDVGVAKITPCFENGKSTVFQNLSNGIGAGTTELHIVRPLGGIERRYVLLFLKTPAFLKDGEAVMTGSAGQKRLPRSYFEGKPFPLPPLAEQSRIVTRVEELMRLCDALEAKGRLEAAQHAQLVSTLLGTLTASATPEELADHWQRVAQHFDLLAGRPAAIDALEQTLLQLAVRGLLVPQDPTDEPASVLLARIRTEKDRLIAAGQIKRDKPLPPITDEEKPFELPVGWEWVRMGAVVNASEAGWSPTCIGSPRRPGLWGVLKVSAVSWGEFDANANKELPSDLVPRPEYEVRDGDFLLSRANTAELVARSVVVEQAEPKLMLSDKIIRLAVSSQMNRSFLNMANNASYAREHYAVNASGTSSSMKNVSREVVLALPVPLPPLAEQSRIVTRVTALRRLCADLRQRLAERQSVQARLAEALVANNAQTSTQQEDECHAA